MDMTCVWISDYLGLTNSGGGDEELTLVGERKPKAALSKSKDADFSAFKSAARLVLTSCTHLLSIYIHSVSNLISILLIHNFVFMDRV